MQNPFTSPPATFRDIEGACVGVVRKYSMLAEYDTALPPFPLPGSMSTSMWKEIMMSGLPRILPVKHQDTEMTSQSESTSDPTNKRPCSEKTDARLDYKKARMAKTSPSDRQLADQSSTQMDEVQEQELGAIDFDALMGMLPIVPPPPLIG